MAFPPFTCPLCHNIVESSKTCANFTSSPNGLIICFNCHGQICFFCYKSPRIQNSPPCCLNCSTLIKPTSKPSPFFHPIGYCAVWSGYSCSLLYTKTLSIKCAPHEHCGLCLELRDWKLCNVHNKKCVLCGHPPENSTSINF